ncbi:plant expansin [Suillus paluster]|uniref:plant expansin n=1 Tax=Suillus paluster TaxID=48578 RepID=UPI001B86D05F|nr:plant expansin [Suillus paluster]KAG1756705.1 plant expansin [Suillus paluster]
MISTFATVLLTLIATSAVSARVVPRATAPSGWDTAALEPYDTYHCRYLSIDCQDQHGTTFFDQCCHPLQANESVDVLPSQCQMPSGVTCNNGEPVTTGGSDDGDCGDEPSSSSTAYTPAPSTSSTLVVATPAPSTSSTPVVATPTPSTSSTLVAATPAPTTTSAPVNVAPVPTSTYAPAPTSPSTASSNSGLTYGGYATYFYQNGNAGACGTVHSDSDYICAMDQALYGNSGNASPLCGKQVQITNLSNGKMVTVTVADDCPTCDNAESIDLSVAAFEAISDLSTGEVSIAWEYL